MSAFCPYSETICGLTIVACVILVLFICYPWVACFYECYIKPTPEWEKRKRWIASLLEEAEKRPTQPPINDYGSISEATHASNEKV